MDNEFVLFKGVSQITIDTKGRMAIPVKHRQVLMETGLGRLVLTVDVDQCLLVYPKPVWQKIELQLTNLPGLNKRVRLVQRILIGHAEECEIDTQGRLLLPSPLRDVAGIKRKAVLVGQGRKLELWNSETWTKQRNRWMKEAGEEKEITDVLESIQL